MIEDENKKIEGNTEDKTKEIKLEKFDTEVYNDMVIEVKGKEGRVYKYTMPFNAPLTECHMAGINVLQKIKEIYDGIIRKQKEEKVDGKEAEPSVKVEPSVEDKN